MRKMAGSAVKFADRGMLKGRLPDSGREFTVAAQTELIQLPVEQGLLVRAVRLMTVSADSCVCRSMRIDPAEGFTGMTAEAEICPNLLQGEIIPASRRMGIILLPVAGKAAPLPDRGMDRHTEIQIIVTAVGHAVLGV